jgi:exodeoxyribonuclease V alpha subunit
MAFRPKDGEALILFGEHAEYRGQKEFAFDGARLDVPVDPRDTLRYCIERTPGAGSMVEDAIWSARGADWQNVAAGEVPRLNGPLFERFRLSIEALNQNRVMAEVVGSLMGKGCTPLQAQKAFDQWKGETLGVVQSDPYRLAELERVTFSDVDSGIRQNYGIGDEDMRRVKAAVVHSLRRLTDAGSTVVEWPALFNKACGLLGGLSPLVNQATKELFKDGVLCGFQHGGGFFALASDYRAENDIWAFVNGTREERL